MTDEWESLSWPGERLNEALLKLAQAGRLEHRGAHVPPPRMELLSAGVEDWNTWIEDAADWIGLEAELVGASYPEVEKMLAGAAPALLFLSSDEKSARFVLLLRGGRRTAEILTPALQRVRIPVGSLRRALCGELERTRDAGIRQLLTRARVPPGRRWERAYKALLSEQLGAQRVGACWMLRYPPGASFWPQVVQRGLHRRLLRFVLVQVALYALWLLSWWMIGRASLQGRLEEGWLQGWALLLMVLVPLRMFATWAAGSLSIEGGALLKQRLLAGSLLLEPEEIRHEGAGRLLSRVLEAEAVESLAVGGGVNSAMATLELLFAAGILWAGAGGGWHLLALGLILGLGALLGWRYWHLRARWTALRLQLTHELSERMQGHRTRLVQETLEQWHQGEEFALERYQEVSREMDRTLALLVTVVPRGWILLGLLGLLPALVVQGTTPSLLAVGVGGILFTRQALQRACMGLSRLAGAALAWREVDVMYRAASRGARQLAPGALSTDIGTVPAPQKAGPVLEARALLFQHPGRSRPAVQGASLSLRAGERVLMEGCSGSGKSSFGALLAGLKAPDSGLLLLKGLDRATLGVRGWRRAVVSAPQFHENHVLTGTFAFNLLMGRGWPARATELVEAEAVCRELELGGLLDRMPGGIQQVVGETGWQLSHGERSRLYIGRALLQNAEVVILDESFAALDPITLRQVMGCVLRRTKTLVVIAHP